MTAPRKPTGSMTIQRYEIPDYDYGVRKVDREPREMDLVTYDDHLAAIAEKDAALKREREVRAGLVEALEAVKASWTNNDPLRAQHILQINDALASAKLLA